MTTSENPDATPTLGLVLVAAGRSRRMGDPVPKQFRKVAGRPLLSWTLRALAVLETLPGVRCTDVVLVLPPDQVVSGRDEVLAGAGAEAFDPDRVRAVPGGAERSDSVAQGVRALGPGVDWVLVHDGARPCPGREMMIRLIEAMPGADGVVPGLAVTDTVKRVDASGIVVETVDRNVLRAVQTPQIFHHRLFRDVLERVTRDTPPADRARFTDCASIMESQGRRIRVVPGDVSNMKVTTPADFELIESRLGRYNEGTPGA